VANIQRTEERANHAGRDEARVLGGREPVCESHSVGFVPAPPCCEMTLSQTGDPATGSYTETMAEVLPEADLAMQAYARAAVAEQLWHDVSR
jgi:hypothetical protein